MNELLRDFFISFVPLFVAIDIIALVPLFLSFTENIEKTEKQTLIHQACATVLVVSLIFPLSL
jgi:small neutral amino acid transporter SnatA (MarC family)